MTPAQIERLKKKRAQHDLLHVGQLMSNILHNAKQLPDVPKWLRDKGAELQEQWDKAKKESAA